MSRPWWRTCTALAGAALLSATATATVTVTATATATATATDAAQADHDRAKPVFRITAPQITESSALVVSTVDEQLVYTMNDSGDGPYVYVLDRSGALVARTTLAGVDPVDVEAMSAAADGRLVVADIGDNTATRDDVSVYRVDQPGAVDAVVTPQRVRLTYADGPRDAESVLYDDRTGRVFVVSKELRGASVYRTRRHVFEHARATLRPVAAAPVLATDAVWVEGGREAVVRGYATATVLSRPGWQRVGSFALPGQPQGESIASPGDGVVWVGSEGERSQVLAVPLPRRPARDEVPGESEPEASPDASAADDQQASAQSAAVRSTVVVMATGIGAVAAVGLLVWGVRAARRRSRRSG